MLNDFLFTKYIKQPSGSDFLSRKFVDYENPFNLHVEKYGSQVQDLQAISMDQNKQGSHFKSVISEKVALVLQDDSKYINSNFDTLALLKRITPIPQGDVMDQMENHVKNVSTLAKSYHYTDLDKLKQNFLLKENTSVKATADELDNLFETSFETDAMSCVNQAALKLYSAHGDLDFGSKADLLIYWKAVSKAAQINESITVILLDKHLAISMGAVVYSTVYLAIHQPQHFAYLTNEMKLFYNTSNAWLESYNVYRKFRSPILNAIVATMSAFFGQFFRNRALEHVKGMLDGNHAAITAGYSILNAVEKAQEGVDEQKIEYRSKLDNVYTDLSKKTTTENLASNFVQSISYNGAKEMTKNARAASTGALDGLTQSESGNTQSFINKLLKYTSSSEEDSSGDDEF